jgi:large subunit ribosomal protein L22
MKASLKNYRQAPRKVRLIANLIKGKSVAVAELELKHLVKRGALPMEKLLASAVANAKMTGADIENLIVKEVRVDQGLVMKRMMPRAFGRGAPIHKKHSHVLLELAEKTAKAPKHAKKVEKTKAPKKEKVEKVATVKKAPKAKAAKK